MKDKEIAIKAAGAVQKQNQVTIYADHAHGAVSNLEFFYSKEHIAEMKANGIKHTFTELDKETFEPLIKNLYAGKISEAEFKQGIAEKFDEGKITGQSKSETRHSAQIIADGIVDMKNNGIKYHTVDYYDEGIALKTENDLLKLSGKTTTAGELKDSYRQKLADGVYKGTTKEEIQKFVNSNIPDDLVMGKGAEKNEFSLALMQARVRGDTQRADQIMKDSHGQKSTAYIGSAHVLGTDEQTKGPKDLEDTLQKRGVDVAVISVAPNMRALNNTVNNKVYPYEEQAVTVILTNSSIMPGNQVEAMHMDGKKLGEVFDVKDLQSKMKGSSYNEISELDLSTLNAPKAIPVNEAEIRGR